MALTLCRKEFQWQALSEMSSKSGLETRQPATTGRSRWCRPAGGIAPEVVEATVVQADEKAVGKCAETGEAAVP